MTSNLSRAARFLSRRPELRARVEGDADYRAWKARLPPVEIDGQLFYFPEGDIQKDEADLIVDFAIRKGLTSTAEVQGETP